MRVRARAHARASKNIGSTLRNDACMFDVLDNAGAPHPLARLRGIYKYLRRIDFGIHRRPAVCLANTLLCNGIGTRHHFQRAKTSTMDPLDYYSDRKFCTQCNAYVAYLMSVDHSYCAECGTEVRLFSKEDWSAFNESMQAKRPKGGRPRKSQNKESA